MMMNMMGMGNGKMGKLGEEKGKGMITDIHIKKLDDGTFTMTCMTDKGENQTTSHESADDMMDAMEDNIKSPHLPKMKTSKDMMGKAMPPKKMPMKPKDMMMSVYKK